MAIERGQLRKITCFIYVVDILIYTYISNIEQIIF